MNTARVFLTALCATLAFAAHSWAQIARGVIVDGSTGAPVRGAFVVLLNEQGQQVTGVLSGEQGEFVFLTRPGRYALRADRIGHRTGTVESFLLADRETRTFRIQLDVNALRLPEISVSGRNRCVGRPDGNRQTAQVWEEARKALTVAVWVESNAAATFRYRVIERELNRQLDETGRPSMRFHSAAGKRAFHAEHPDSLMQYGYVQDRRGDTFLFGPDAELLLSNSFLDQHCFQLVRRANRPGLLGLAFEPISGRRLPDIRGVLWLDERSAELRFIEFGYTNRQMYDDQRYAGGRTNFRQLPNGAWIVQNWYIRAPRLGALTGGELRVIGAFETGGEVLDAQVAGAQNTVLVPRTAIAGIVFDNVRHRPLDGARVYLSGTPFSTQAGVDGRFRLDSVPVGDYFIAFEHTWLDSLPIFPPPVRVTADSSGVANLFLVVPTAERLIDEVCPLEERLRLSRAARDTTPPNHGVLYGTVRSPDGVGNDVEVGATWRRVFAISGAAQARISDMRVRPHTMATSVGPDGKYLLCAVPIDHPIQLDVSVRNYRVRADSVRLIWPGLMRRDFVLPRR
ncbi:MAG: carboxypeptidase regulatory-like domain-containing protein [Longimicrobiales bacterium]